MYPDLSYFFHDIFGTQPDNWTSVFKTFGVMLVVAILAASLFLYLELKRKAEEGLYKPTTVKITIGEPATIWEIASNALFGLLIGLKLVYIFQHFPEFQKDAAAVLLSLKGNWPAGIGLAILFGALRWWEKKKQALPKPKEVVSNVYPHDRIGDITIIAALAGILGAKVFAILEAPSGFLADPLGTFFSGSGLAFYGGLIFGALGVTWYLRKNNIPFWPTADAVAPCLIISYGVGRIGCQLAGDGDWGIAAAAQPDWWFLPDWFWAYDYPHNVSNADVAIEGCKWLHCSHLANPVYPTPLYEVIACLLIGGFIWAIRKRVKVPGMIFFIYLILNGFERFWIEKIRVNETYKIAGFEPTQAEILAVVLFVVGVVGAVWVKRRHAQT